MADLSSHPGCSCYHFAGHNHLAEQEYESRELKRIYSCHNASLESRSKGEIGESELKLKDGKGWETYCFGFRKGGCGVETRFETVTYFRLKLY